MSRIGKRKIFIPEEVKVDLNGYEIKISGPLGTLADKFVSEIKINIEDNHILVTRPNDLRRNKMLHGTINSLIQNMVIGVTKGFEKTLEIKGVGYNVILKNNELLFSLGYSHKITVKIPQELQVEVPRPIKIVIKGIDKQLVGQFASQIKSLRKPDPYGGKGIRYQNEEILRKAGKASSK